jgi:hypothetical protein
MGGYVFRLEAAFFQDAFQAGNDFRRRHGFADEVDGTEFDEL